MNKKIQAEQMQNCRINMEYMLNIIEPTFTINAFVPNKFKDMNISQSTFKNAYYGKQLSSKTLGILAASFSNYLLSTGQYISPADLLLPFDEFIQKYPENGFQRNDYQNPSELIDIYVNKIYRCYYMNPASPNIAALGYFKLQKKKSSFSAYLLRGIYDFSDLKYPKECFDDAEKLFKEVEKSRNSDESRNRSLNLYIAEDSDISYTENCIKINFNSKEEVPCKSTMFWNIDIPNKTKVTHYIGGMALIVDTNDGLRGHDISAFKMGLEEAIEDSPKLPPEKTSPINRLSQNLINELLIDPSKPQACIVDNACDARWYRFLQGTDERKITSKSYSLEDLLDLTRDLLKLKSELTELLDSQKNSAT